jgi:tetratricopeptide (TPR) repeat protein
MLSISQFQFLPLKQWPDFESLCHELFRADWGDFHAQKHGRPGYCQHGVDVYGRSAYHNGYAGVQCKCRDLLVRRSLTESQLLNEVSEARKFKPPLKQFTIATTLRRNPRHQQWARDITERHKRKGLFSVHVLSWDDITDMLARHPAIAQRYYPHLFPQHTVAPTEALSPPMATTPPTPSPSSSPAVPKTSATAIVLPPHTHSALGIIATSPVPILEEWLKQFFPAIEWGDEISVLRKADAITIEEGRIRAREAVAASFFDTADDRKQFVQKWCDVLTPLSGHPDTAFLLSVLHVTSGNLRDGIRTLLDVAYNLEPGTWNETYRTTLKNFDVPKFHRIMRPDERVDFLNVLGLCHARSTKPLDAILYFQRLRKYSVRIGNQWAIGQSFINAGVAYLDAEETVSAERELRRAERHARKHRDFLLLGRTLHNLASLTVQRDPDGADKLLAASIGARKKAHDHPHGVAPTLARGIIAARRGDHRSALQWFTRAEKKAANTDQRDARCTALHNMGQARLDMDDVRGAIRLFEAARKLASEEGFHQHLIRTTGSEAYARNLLRQYGRAAPLFREHANLLLSSHRYEEAAVALHDTAVMLTRARDASARTAFRDALRFAIKHKIHDWVYQCLRDEALLCSEQGDVDSAIKKLRHSIAVQGQKANHVIAANLHEDLVRLLIERKRSVQDIERAFADTLSAWQSAGAPEKACAIYEWLYSWKWSAGRCREAITTLRELSRFASRHALRDHQSRALDQTGFCFQQLGSYCQAEVAHTEAIALARKSKDQLALENALNNLGELFRKTDRPAEALKPLLEAESIALADGDEESVLSIAHNRALALFASGDRTAARRLLRTCRDKAKRNGWHHEFVRALLGLGNFAWESKEPAEAERLYRQALRDARRHDATEQIWQIALDLGYALRCRKKFKQALDLLQLAADTCDDPLQLSQCYLQIAACKEDCGLEKAAQKAWLQCRDLALAANDRETVAIASASLGAGHADSGAFHQAHRDIETAYQHEDNPVDRGHLLLDHLRILLAGKRDKEATKVFVTLRRLARKERALSDVMIDAHVAIAEYKWTEDKRKLESLKAYIAALNDSYSIGIERAFEVGSHLAKMLFSIPAGDRCGRLDDYEKRLKAWLHRTNKTPPPPLVQRALLWPLRVTRRITQSPRAGADLSAHQIGKLIGEELGINRQP